MKFWAKAVACFSVAAFLGLASGCSGGAERPSAAQGKLSPEQYFTLRDLNGSPLSLQQLLSEKRAVLVNFWASWCPPCREEIPGLIELESRYAGRPFAVLGVDIGESQAKVSSFVQKIGINYRVLLDSDQRVAESYGVVGIPTSVLVKSDGSILGEYHAYTPQLVRDVEKVMGETD